jgi:hypothetical protein
MLKRTWEKYTENSSGDPIVRQAYSSHTAVEYLAFMLRIWEVTGSIVGMET